MNCVTLYRLLFIDFFINMLFYRTKKFYWFFTNFISSNINEVLLINPSANVFVFGNLTSIIRTGSHIVVELIDLVNSVIIFLSQMTLLRWLTFLLGSLTVILTVLLFWIYLFLLTLVFVLQWLSLHWEILIMLLSQFPLTFCWTHNRMHCFNA